MCLKAWNQYGVTLSGDLVREFQKAKLSEQNCPKRQTLLRIDPLCLKLLLAFLYFEENELLTFFQEKESNHCDLLFNVFPGKRIKSL